MKTLINLETVDSLKSLGDPDLFDRLVDLFSETGKRQVDSIHQFMQSNNWSQLHLEAHSLKSSAMSLGADELGNMCLILETKTSDATELEKQSALVPKLQEVFANSITELKALQNKG